MLLIIILTGLSDNEPETRYLASDDFMQKLTKLENDRLSFRSNFVRLLDLNDFQYVINTKCNYSNEDFENVVNNKGKFKAVWIITSYAGDVSKRSALRRAYSTEELRELGVRRIFLLGSLDDSAQKKTGVTQAAIEDEARRFQDIIQGNFIEAYKNLTYKHLMGLQWAVDNCSGGYSYIIKMDDDVVVNLYEALLLLQNKSRSNTKIDFLMGYEMKHMKPIRNQANKWYVTYEEFPQETYPDFLSGWFYATDMLTALKLIYQSRHHSKYFWIDDLFITGILREEAGIHSIINIKETFTSDYRFLECCLKDQEKTKYKCDFLVGPDGADPHILLKFKKYSEDCYRKYNCESRPKDQLLKDICILNYENSNLGTGIVQVEKLLSSAAF